MIQTPRQSALADEPIQLQLFHHDLDLEQASDDLDATNGRRTVKARQPGHRRSVTGGTDPAYKEHRRYKPQSVAPKAARSGRSEKKNPIQLDLFRNQEGDENAEADREDQMVAEITMYADLDTVEMQTMAVH